MIGGRSWSTCSMATLFAPLPSPTGPEIRAPKLVFQDDERPLVSKVVCSVCTRCELRLLNDTEEIGTSVIPSL